MDRVAALASVSHFVRAPDYRTRPFGPVAQPDFVNSAAGFLTTLGPHELLAALRDIERELGREPATERWGPRAIDLDLLVLGNMRLSDAVVTLPHPGIAQRAFVLLPLTDIAPSLEVPGVGIVSGLLRAVSTEGAERLP
jgi:2-amino-4-hydroxy-6-hydroxymethyldihydropteridine diphosphokinase